MSKEEQSQTDRLVAWAAEHGLEIAKFQAPPAKDVDGILTIDEINFIPPGIYAAFCPLSDVGRKRSKLPTLIYRLKWKLRIIKSTYKDFVFKARHRFKLPEGWCCWDMNVCYDVTCPECDYDYWACAYCRHQDPCAKCNN